MALNTNMHVTRDQAVTMLGAVIAKKRLLQHTPLDALEGDAAHDLIRLAGCEGMLRAALERISDLEARRNREAQARRPIRDRLANGSKPASLRSPW